MIEKSIFFNNLVDYSVKDEDFSFLGAADELDAPQKMSSRMQFALGAAAGVAFGIFGGMASGYMKGSADYDALIADLRKMLDCSDVIGIRLKDGMAVLRLGIDADELTGEALIGRFAIIHERATEFRKYAYTIMRSWINETKLPTVSQGVVVFSKHQKAKQFIQQHGDKCKHYTFWKGVRTQPWVVDLQEEVITRCSGLWQLANMLPLDSEKARAGLFHRRVDARAEERRRVADTSNKVMPLAQTRNIIADYGALLERNPSFPTRIEDISALPHPKEIILDALLLEIRAGHPEKMDTMLKHAASCLAQFQPSVGSEPLQMLGVDITTLPKTNDLAALRAQAELIAESESKTKARYDEFDKLVKADLQRILSKIAAASAKGST